MSPASTTGAADAFGEAFTGSPATVAAWDTAWASFLHFRDDPLAVLDEVDDPDACLPATFTATYRILGGMQLDTPVVVEAVAKAARAAERGSARDRGHARAVGLLAAGAFADAAAQWDTVAASHDRDLAAVRFAHDVYLHIGDAEGRLRSSTAALGRWTSDQPGAGAVLGMHAFSLEEAGHFGEAAEAGVQALALDPDDAWARHALAHVYESIDDHDAAIAVLVPEIARWQEQDSLATHLWWHLALRYLAAGDIEAALGIHDRCLPGAATAFRLSDLASLLWRAELAGHDVGDRWDTLADRWAAIAEIHTCGFLDLHAALTFARRPGHPGAAAFWHGAATTHAGGTTHNDQTFLTVVQPLVAAVHAYGEGRFADAVTGFDAVAGDLHRIGGSVVQRDIVRMTRDAAEEQCR